MITQFDLRILNWIQEYIKNDVLDGIMPIITTLGNGGIFWIIVAMFCMASKKTRRMGAQMICAMALGYLIGNLGIKILIARQRPYTINTDIALLIAKPKDFSFPSGHTLASFEAAITIFFYYKKCGICALVLAALIAFSRLYLYVHFPSDVIAGTLLAIAISFIMKEIFQKYVH